MLLLPLPHSLPSILPPLFPIIVPCLLPTTPASTTLTLSIPLHLNLHYHLSSLPTITHPSLPISPINIWKTIIPWSYLPPKRSRNPDIPEIHTTTIPSSSHHSHPSQRTLSKPQAIPKSIPPHPRFPLHWSPTPSFLTYPWHLQGKISHTICTGYSQAKNCFH